MKSRFLTLIILLPVLGVCCDMIAIAGDITIDKQNYAVEFLKSQSNSRTNNDGYGIAWYNSKWHSKFKSGKKRWFGDGDIEPLNELQNWKIGMSGYPEILMLHARNASKGYGSHPFFLEIDRKKWAFMHNGKISDELQRYMMDYLGDYWFSVHRSNWVDDTENIIDSELFFHYITARFTKGSEIEEILEDINFLEKNSNQKSTLNFVLTDGNILYAFKNSPAKDYKHKLSWQLTNETLIIKTDKKTGKMLSPGELLYFQEGQVSLKNIQ